MTGSAPRTVLLAEDEPHIVESLSFLLGRAGFVVTVVTDGEAAIRRATAETPDVLVLDVMMPGLNGFEVLRRLRAEERTARLPIVMLTAKGQREDREAALRHGADVFMAKPFSNAELIATVLRLAGAEAR